MLTPEAAELGVISSITTSKDVSELLRDGFTGGSFIIYGAMFDYILEYGKNYDGQVPRSTDLEQYFKEDGLKLESPGELRFFADEVQRQDSARRAQRAILERLGTNGDLLTSDPDEAIRLLAEDLRKLNKQPTRNVAFLDRDAMIRLGWLKERQLAAQEGRVLGIPTGLRVFDDQLQGWQPGEAIMVMAPKGIGKSWMLMYFACVAYKAGYKVLFFSPEMAWEECALRYDVLLAAMYEQELSHTELLTGKMEDTI